MDGFKESDPTFATRAIHAYQDPEQWQDGKPIVLPISLATTFKQDSPADFVVSAFLFFSFFSYFSPFIVRA